MAPLEKKKTLNQPHVFWQLEQFELFIEYVSRTFLNRVKKFAYK